MGAGIGGGCSGEWPAAGIGLVRSTPARGARGRIAKALALCGRSLAMFGLTTATRVFLAPGATDMRKGFEGLFGLVRDVLGEDPLSGHLFLFANATRTRIKVLVFDGSGLWVCAKRLEKGRFAWPSAGNGQTRIVMRAEELTMLLSGIDLQQARPRKWFRKPEAA
jgi:transposase